MSTSNSLIEVVRGNALGASLDYCQREIVAVAAFVVGLEVVATCLDECAIGQIGEGAADRCPGGVAYHRKDGAAGELFIRYGGEAKLRAALDRYAFGNHLVGSRLVRVELTGVGAVRFECQCLIDCESC